MGNLLTVRVGNILTALLGNVLTAGVGKVLDIYNRPLLLGMVKTTGGEEHPGGVSPASTRRSLGVAG